MNVNQATADLMMKSIGSLAKIVYFAFVEIGRAVEAKEAQRLMTQQISSQPSPADIDMDTRAATIEAPDVELIDDVHPAEKQLVSEQTSAPADEPGAVEIPTDAVAMPVPIIAEQSECETESAEVIAPLSPEIPAVPSEPVSEAVVSIEEKPEETAVAAIAEVDTAAAVEPELPPPTEIIVAAEEAGETNVAEVSESRREAVQYEQFVDLSEPVAAAPEAPVVEEPHAAPATEQSSDEQRGEQKKIRRQPERKPTAAKEPPARVAEQSAPVAPEVRHKPQPAPAEVPALDAKRTESFRRAIVTVLSLGQGRGLKAIEIAMKLRIPPVIAERLLQELVHEMMVAFDSRSQLYTRLSTHGKKRRGTR